MIRGQWFLVIVLTLSSLALVNARYHERRLFAGGTYCATKSSTN